MTDKIVGVDTLHTAVQEGIDGIDFSAALKSGVFAIEEPTGLWGLLSAHC